jgi:MFS family permease
MAEIIYPKYRWFVLITMFVVTAASLSIMISPTPFAGEIAKDLKVDLGIVLASSMMVFLFGTAISALAGGFLIDRIGLVPMWIICSVVAIVATLLFPVFGHTLGGLIALRAMQGLVNGPISSSVTTCCAQWFKYKERTYVAGVQGFSVSIGMGVGVIFAPAFFNVTHSWQIALAWTALLPAIGLVFAVIVQFGPKAPNLIVTSQADGSAKLFSGDFKKAVTFITFYVLCLMGFIDSWCQQAYNDMANGYYAVARPVGLGLGPMGAGSRLVYASYAMAIGTLSAPVITEKIFKGNPKPTIFIGCGIAGLLVLTIRTLQPDNTALLIAVPCAILFFSSFVNPTLYGYIAKHYPSSISGRIGGLVMGLTIFGATVGLGVSSTLLHKTGFYWASMNVLAGVTMLGAIAVLALRLPKGFNVAEQEGR